MRALVLKENGYIVDERPMPEPDAGEVLFRTHYSGVCGTDLHAPQLGTYGKDVVIGHEFAGEVVAVGPGVQGWQIGERAAIHPKGDSCGSCPECREGWRNLCSDPVVSINPGILRDGGMAAFASIPSGKLRRLPEEVSLLEGAWAEPIAVALRSVNRSGFPVGRRAVVVGAGPIGLLVTMLLRHAGATHITVLEPSEMRRDKAAEVGADLTINPISDDPTTIFGSSLPRPDYVFECSAAVPALASAVEIIKPHGTLTLVGVPMEMIPLPSYRAITKEINIRTSVSNVDEIDRAIELLAAKKLDVAPLTSEVVPLEGVLGAIERLEQGRAIKVLVQPDE
ncbi:MAG: alcohol dehydrogenase catalytic domain-containing protein [Chloroflexi bacterium]|nr:alcohol dehydrogenase catalytic domain-containing protein [Chloroflexota bacterium]